MAARRLTLPAVAQAVAFAAAAVLIAVVSLSTHQPARSPRAAPSAPAGLVEPPPLLRRCEGPVRAVGREPACQAAWAILRARVLGGLRPAEPVLAVGRGPGGAEGRP